MLSRYQKIRDIIENLKCPVCYGSGIEIHYSSFKIGEPKEIECTKCFGKGFLFNFNGICKIIDLFNH